VVFLVSPPESGGVRCAFRHSGGWSVRLFYRIALSTFLDFNTLILNHQNVKIQKIRNTPQLRDYRKKLRRNSTSAEAELWNLLKGKKLEGRKFRRQYSICKYILDFFCVSEQLAIELDGDLHGDYIVIQKDEEREKYLESLGIKLIRFENRMVFQEPEDVLNTIKSVFKHE